MLLQTCANPLNVSSLFLARKLTSVFAKMSNCSEVCTVSDEGSVGFHCGRRDPDRDKDGVKTWVKLNLFVCSGVLTYKDSLVICAETLP